MSSKTGERILNLTKKQLKDKNRIKELEDMVLALSTENKELEAKVNKWVSMQEKGYTAVAINNNLIVDAVKVLPYSTFTYTQDIPEAINTALYNKIPYYELQDGKICINTAQKIKYNTGGLL